MPLHLLGKKSWNVYNSENIARVKRDEDAAKAQIEENERNQRDVESSARLRALRSEELTLPASKSIQKRQQVRSDQSSRDIARKRRKLAGEDDTDRDIRLAKVFTEAVPETRQNPLPKGSDGHFELVARPQHSRETETEPEHNEDSVGMRFKDAAGYQSSGKPWYSHEKSHDASIHRIDKDVWGNADPRRHERENQRLVANDPLLAMKRGVRQLREHKKQRQEWIEQREKDLYEVERLARERPKSGRRRDGDEESLEGFSLDDPTSGTTPMRHSNRSRDRDGTHKSHRHRRRSRSPDRKRRSHHLHRSRHGMELQKPMSER